MTQCLKRLYNLCGWLLLCLRHGYAILKSVLFGFCLSAVLILPAHAAADLDVNTPAVAAVKASMQSRHRQLLPHYQSGAVGLTADGFVAVKEAGLVPLSQRSALAALVKDENADRTQLYQGIAAANGHSEWEGEIQRTFAQRWIDKAQTGWFVQRDGRWLPK
ncbi:YdbL family protein [Methylophilus sp. 5]|uniref:YdbL family protein n=1 Tax=Methylophilus sp. 5 TaxID=1112274 RepID=UPI0004BBA86F|nr:YdbL family protein [Methylophilus sp. 5]